MNAHTTAQEWFALGEKVPYDRRTKRILRPGDTFHIVGSDGDPFERKQIVKARERLGEYELDIRVLPGGHLTTSEHPELLAEIIQELGRKNGGYMEAKEVTR